MKKAHIFRKGTQYILPLGTNYLDLHKLLVYLLCVKLTIFCIMKINKYYLQKISDTSCVKRIYIIILYSLVKKKVKFDTPRLSIFVYNVLKL